MKIIEKNEKVLSKNTVFYILNQKTIFNGQICSNVFYFREQKTILRNNPREAIKVLTFFIYLYLYYL